MYTGVLISFDHHVPTTGLHRAKCFGMKNSTGSGSQDKTKSRFGHGPEHCYFMLRGYAMRSMHLL